ncbi:MAG: ATP-dependent sacrificial sulfur transferase LarE [Lentisphaerae bacterium]|nr:ATP-dependent sacrificial sulfur transferase LarE [Lentisphaerota bacterium]
MINDRKTKLDYLRQNLRKIGSLVVAFSGGVDSTFLVAVAHEELGDRLLAVTATSPIHPEYERLEAMKLASSLGIRHKIVESNELEIENFRKNPTNRCYYCKKALFAIIKDVAAMHGICVVADGTTVDDLSDYRPGKLAAKEMGIISPLLEADIGKEEIRTFSSEMGLATASKPSFPCLASRIPYGSEITKEKLKAVDSVERSLHNMGFGQMRVRHHGDIARIELDVKQINMACNLEMRERMVKAARSAGFTYVTLDLEGYRTGSLNIRIEDM